MPKSFLIVLGEAIIVGLALVPFTYMAGMLARYVTRRPTLPEICGTWNQFYAMEITLVIAGILFHVAFEYLGINKYYVDRYYA